VNRIARARPSPAMVVALIALFVALSGVGWAALRLEPNSITSKYLKNNRAVKNKDVVNDTLQGNKIAESTLGQVPAAVTADSARTATSADTATTSGNADLLDGLNATDFLGANAKAADSELLDGLDSTAFLRSTVTVRNSANVDVPNNAIAGTRADCNPGETVIAGGAIWSTTPVRNQMPMLEGAPITPALDGWSVTMGNTSGSTKTFNAVAVCVAG
jgi:hypothetical protein